MYKYYYFSLNYFKLLNNKKISKKANIMIKSAKKIPKIAAINDINKATNYINKATAKIVKTGTKIQ